MHPSNSPLALLIALVALATLTSSSTPPEPTPTPAPSASSAHQLQSNDNGNSQWLHPFLPAALAFLPTELDGNLTSTSTDHDCSDDASDSNSNSDSPNGQSTDLKRLLGKRQSCASGYSPCRNAGYCCSDSAICETDINGQVGCCPQGAACTGAVPSSTMPGAAQSTIGSSFVLAGGMTTSAPATSQATGGPQVVVTGSTVAFVAGTGASDGVKLSSEGALRWVGGVVLGAAGFVGLV